MSFNKKINYEVDNVLFDYKLFDTLKAIRDTKSQRKAAQKLDIAHSVLNRRILSAEDELSQQLVIVSNRGSVLTEYANNLLEEYEAYEQRLNDDDEKITIAGGHISCEFLRQLAIAYRLENIRIIETDFDTSVDLANMGVVDILGFDDPVKAYMMNLEPIPLARDCLMLLSHNKQEFNKRSDIDGLKFVEVEGSAQRLAWITLANYDIDFDIVKVVNSFHEAIRMVEQDESLYTFINKSMSYRCQYTSDVISEETHHIISALNVKNSSYVDNFLNFASHRAQNFTVKYGFEHL